MKLRITIWKYSSWYLCQITLQIKLLPILNKYQWGVVDKSFHMIRYCYELFNSLLIIETAFFNALFASFAQLIQEYLLFCALTGALDL